MRIAIICAGPCDRKFLHEFRNNRKPDYCIAADRGLLTCLDAGLMPDCVLGDYDSLIQDASEGADGEESSVLSQINEYHANLLEKLGKEGKRILTYPARKDFSDSEAAVREAVRIIEDEWQKEKFLRETDVHDEIYLLGATGGRLDHFLANLAVLMIPTKLGIRAWILDERNEITLLREGCILPRNRTFGKYVSLIPYTDEVTGVVLKGFRYLLHGHTLTRDNTLGLSNEIEDEIAEISFDSGILIMILSMD